MEEKDRKILSFRDLEIGYRSGNIPKVLLPPLNASSGKGELIAVIGKNGIGKSTLLKTIAGLCPVISGSLLIDDKDIGSYSRIQLSGVTGYISTDIVKVSNMKVYDLVSLGRFPHTNWFGRIDRSNHNAIMNALDKAGMNDFIDRQITELSDGERQKAMIAMVLAQDATLMVMDEPTAFLDLSSKYEVIHLMHQLTRKREKTIIYSTHDLATAISQADKIWLLTADGLLEGAPEDIMIGGSFRSLFDPSKVTYNSADGSFSITNEFRGGFKIRGEGETKFWTERAFLRAGFSADYPDPVFTVEIPSGPNNFWKCYLAGDSGSFASIYDLISWINKKTIS